MDTDQRRLELLRERKERMSERLIEGNLSDDESYAFFLSLWRADKALRDADGIAPKSKNPTDLQDAAERNARQAEILTALRDFILVHTVTSEEIPAAVSEHIQKLEADELRGQALITAVEDLSTFFQYDKEVRKKIVTYLAALENPALFEGGMDDK